MVFKMKKKLIINKFKHKNNYNNKIIKKIRFSFKIFQTMEKQIYKYNMKNICSKSNKINKKMKNKIKIKKRQL